MISDVENEKKKRYGQYFSGARVADLLVSLIPQEVIIGSVLDPMVGSGDMLKAILKRTYCKNICGIDIDNNVVDELEAESIGYEVFCEDAFCSKRINKKEGWDLVITNPPYVRYQLLNSNDKVGLPTGEVVRKHLHSFVEKNENIDDDEKELLMRLVVNYSGLSDLAVPSWLLCASLVKKGGYLAMVVPDTWLNRDYALPIHYMLLKLFDVQCVVKDTESAWFENATVKTCLVVAKKKEHIISIKDYEGTTRLAEVDASVIGEDSLVQKTQYDSIGGKEAFLKIMKSSENIECYGIRAKTVLTDTLFPSLFRIIQNLSWIDKSDKDLSLMKTTVPEELTNCLETEIQYESLEELGWSIGQGLRTGANDFFYFDIVQMEEDYLVIKTRNWDGNEYKIPKKYARSALQTRNEISGLCIRNEMLHKSILYLPNRCTEKDYGVLAGIVKRDYEIVDEQTEAYIDKASQYTIEKKNVRFNELSAVKPNEKKTKDGYKQFWYNLPVLQSRHVPDLCVSRLCGKSVECLYVSNLGADRIIVDANFITLWNKNLEDHMYAFALLNSNWFKCYMEIIGTRMGGGALKVEASHLRQVMFPKTSERTKAIICDLGKRLMNCEGDRDDIRRQIDISLLSVIDREIVGEASTRIDNLLLRKLGERGAHE